ncbi:MAG: HipA domain-containing protein [Prolixibacteraceae bacterium]|jgi:serine/threonine-protein kinase HipA|nr:HipA domain-containing protein [Prolixibacteraceae bacterium]MBT6004950.1 HipA domain-containing protein [Prolixibacteraceae bacterium]MBT6763809.1 HipA domain-containing protein [Prolixibacteraceae bacterium]MBT7393852.1 HipA domain-containing protein [Prolixibacteraceae bacterium]
MNLPIIKYCPGTLTSGYDTYSRTCLRRMFNGRKVNHVLPYESPANNSATDDLFLENQKRISISGVQEKFSVLLEKNKLRLIEEGEHGSYILKSIPNTGKNFSQMPANEHLTMQIARQVFNIETAENALIFFNNGMPAYITKRFDVKDDGSKLAKEDFASLAGRTPQTHGENYKYLGNYLEMFEIMKVHLPAYKPEAPKLFSLLVFNYLFSNGDAHFKNFSLIETPFGDFRLSPAYDLLNTRIHIEDSDFALDDKLLPKNIANGNVLVQFNLLADKAELSKKQKNEIFDNLLSKSNKVEKLINASFLNDKLKHNYTLAYQTRLKKLNKQSK